MQQLRILLIGIESPDSDALHQAFVRAGAEVVRMESADAAGFHHFETGLCVAGVQDGSDQTVDSIARLRKQLSGIPLVVLTPQIDVDGVMRVVRSGAAEVIGLPASPSEVAARALEFAGTPAGRDASARIVGQGAPISHVKEEVRQAANSDGTVLITGETGSGKQLVAQAVHDQSDRAADPFVHVDCGLLASSLIESELFGHERGAFTGAFARRAGRFELAGDGTVFLDEIGELQPELQVKLLRVLETGEFERLGGTKTLRTGARVIAATHRDLRKAISAKQFRLDLYFRLEIFQIHVPPLRDRPEDIPLLVQSLLSDLAGKYGQIVPHFSDAFVARMQSSSWPGNVRQLRNLLERLVARGAGASLDSCDLDGLPPFEDALPDEGTHRLPSGKELSRLEWAERARIIETLELTGGNVLRASRILGLSREKLRYRVHRKYELGSILPKD